MDILKGQIQEKNDIFEGLMKQIPAHYYLSGADDDLDLEEEITVDDTNPFYRQLLKEGLPDDEIQQRLSAYNYRLAKYDPNAPRSIVDIQKARAQVEKDQSQNYLLPQSTLNARRLSISQASSNSSSKDDLLMERKRAAATRDDKRRKRQEERKLQHDRNSQKQGNKVKGLSKEEREAYKKARDEALSNPTPNSQHPESPMHLSDHNEPSRLEHDSPSQPTSTSASSSQLDFDFSTLDFTENGLSKKHFKKDPKAALEKIQRHKEYLNKLTDEKREAVTERDKWQSAEIRATGGKIRDDEKRLAKMVKRQEKLKAKKAAAWKERIDKTQAAQQARASKRQTNLANRAEAKKNKRLGIKPAKTSGKPKSSATTKARSKNRPGFEGGKRKK